MVCTHVDLYVEEKLRDWARDGELLALFFCGQDEHWMIYLYKGLCTCKWFDALLDFLGVTDDEECVCARAMYAYCTVTCTEKVARGVIAGPDRQALCDAPDAWDRFLALIVFPMLRAVVLTMCDKTDAISLKNPATRSKFDAFFYTDPFEIKSLAYRTSHADKSQHMTNVLNLLLFQRKEADGTPAPKTGASDWPGILEVFMHFEELLVAWRKSKSPCTRCEN